MNGELIKTKLDIVVSPSQLRQSVLENRIGLTIRQELLKISSTASQLVAEWSGTTAQLNCAVALRDVVNADNIPTLADVSAVFDNSTSVHIIVNHLQSVLRYAGVEITDTQLAETALSILSSYYFLNLAELFVFFSQLKNGSRGQFVWGTKINNQAIMVALSNFCREMRQEMEKGYSRLENLTKGIVMGTLEVRKKAEEAKKNYEAFCRFFPRLPDAYNPHVLWKAWGGDADALRQIYGANVPPADIAERDIGRYLCEYNIAKSREDSKA